MLKKQIIPIVRAFQSALPRGERRTRSYNPTACKRFQSALPRGERQQIGGSLDEDRNISIHAPARGATVSLVTRDSAHKHFNPRSREGSDALYVESSNSANYFNPRSREGSDRKYTQTTNIISVYFYLYYIIFVSLATNTAYITITKPSKCRCESPYTFC